MRVFSRMLSVGIHTPHSDLRLNSVRLHRLSLDVHVKAKIAEPILYMYSYLFEVHELRQFKMI